VCGCGCVVGGWCVFGVVLGLGGVGFVFFGVLCVGGGGGVVGGDFHVC